MSEPARFEYTEPDGSTVEVTMGREAHRRCVPDRQQAAFFIAPTPALAARLNAVTQAAAARISDRLDSWMRKTLGTLLAVDTSICDADALSDLAQSRGVTFTPYRNAAGGQRIELWRVGVCAFAIELDRPCHGDAN